MIGYFSELNVVIDKCLELIKSDKTLCRLIEYDEENPLSLNHPEVIPDSLIFKKVFPLPKQPDSQLTKGTLLNVYFVSGKPWNKNSGFKKEILLIDILCHLNTWKTDSGLRPYLISERLDLLFNDKKINDMSDNRVYFDSWTGMNFSDYWYGFRTAYILTNNSNVVYSNGMKG